MKNVLTEVMVYTTFSNYRTVDGASRFDPNIGVSVEFVRDRPGSPLFHLVEDVTPRQFKRLLELLGQCERIPMNADSAYVDSADQLVMGWEVQN